MTTFTSGSQPSKKKKRPLHDSMPFLMPYVTDGPASTNLSDTNDIEILSSQFSNEVPVVYSPTPEEETVTASAV